VQKHIISYNLLHDRIFKHTDTSYRKLSPTDEATL